MFEQPAIMRGTVVHERIRPVRHRHEYGVFSILVDLDDFDHLARRRLFGIDRFNLLSFHTRNMADGSQQDLAAYARKKVFDETGIGGICQVWLLTFPSFLGYVFNPLSVYFCLDDNKKPVAVVYEVSNTFGDRTSYVCKVEEGRVEASPKRMLVSPFNGTSGRYRFNLLISEDEMTVGVALHEENRAVLRTHLRSAASPFTDAGIVRAAASYPFMTLKVIAAIHFEAARLFLKGLRFPKKVSQARKQQPVAAPAISSDRGTAKLDS